MTSLSSKIPAAVLGLALLPGTARCDAVDAYLKAQMAANHIPGLVVAVAKHGHILKLKSYGYSNLEFGARATPDTPFQIASTTKAFTGMLLMQLVACGKIRLDDSVCKYLPNAPAAWKPVTIRTLAAHMSGIPEAGPEVGLNASVDDVVNAAAKLPLDHAPGAKSGYGSSDFVVLAKVIQAVTSKSYPQLVGDRIVKVLDLKNTQFDFGKQMGSLRTASLVPGRAAVYRWSNNREGVHSFFFPEHAYAAGGLYTSARDLTTWATALQSGKLLGASARAEMWQPNRLTSGELTTWAIGWVSRTYEGRRTVGHSGGPALSDLLIFPDDGLTVVVLQNQQSMYPYLAQGVADLYLAPHPASIRAFGQDPDPGIKAGLARFVRGLGSGNVPASAFADDQKELLQDVRTLLVPFARSLGHAESVTLVKRIVEEHDTERIFAAQYGRKIVRWILDVDAKGKIVGMNTETP